MGKDNVGYVTARINEQTHERVMFACSRSPTC